MLDEKTICSESGCDQEVCWKGYCASHGREKLPVTNCGPHCNKLRDVFTSKVVMEAVQCSCADCTGTNSATSEVTEDDNDLYRYKIVVYRTKQSEVETIGIFDFKEGSATELYKFLSSRESQEARLKSHGEIGLKPLTITEKASSPITTEPLPEVVDISSLPPSSTTSNSSTSSLDSLNMSVPESRVISPASTTSSVAPLSPAPTLPSPHSSHIPSPRARVIPRSPTTTVPPHHAAPGHHRSSSLGSTPLTTAITTNTPHPGAVRPATNAATSGSASAGKKPLVKRVGQVLTPVREMQQLAAQRRQSATAPKPTRPPVTDGSKPVERRGSDGKSSISTPPVHTATHSSTTGAGHRGSFKAELGSPDGRLTPSSRAAKSHLTLTAVTQGPAPGPAPPSLLTQKSAGSLPTPPVTRRSSLPKISTRPGGGPSLQEREVTEYKDSKDLRKPDNPTEFMTLTLHHLQSRNWKEEFNALDDVRALAIYNPDIVVANFNTLIPLIEAQVDNLRSSNAKNSLLCCTELFKRTGKYLDNHVAQLLPHIVKRAAEGTFIAKDGDIAIQTMIEYCNPHRVLKGVFAFAQGDKATAIKSVLAKTLYLAIGKTKPAFLDHADLGTLCTVISPYLYEKTPEIRTFAKDGVMALSRLATQSGKQKKLQEMIKRNVNLKFKDRFDEAVLQADKLSTPIGQAKRPSATTTNGITPKELKRLPSRDAPPHLQSPPSPTHATSPIPPSVHLTHLGHEGTSTQTVPESPSSTLLTDRPDSPPDFI